MPLIRISHAAAYDQSVKDALMKDVTEAYACATKCDPSKVWIIVEEVAREDWSTGGLSLASKSKASAT